MISQNLQPSTIGEGQKIPRNLTKLGRTTGQYRLASAIWVNEGLAPGQMRCRNGKNHRQKNRTARSYSCRRSIQTIEASGAGTRFRIGPLAALGHELIELGLVLGQPQPG